ncbi:hypothetical protein NCC49_005099 [Naganishia albida]|nr:hypothetical protein NCC49_005099 [Naganishia albida]
MNDTPPPPYTPTVEETVRQEGAIVRVHQGRGISEHVVPVLRYAYPAPSRAAEPEEALSPSVSIAGPGVVTPSSSESSAGRRGSFAERFTNTARHVLHLPGSSAPPVPPRSPRRPVTANAVLQGSSAPPIPISYLPRPTTEGIVPSPIPEVSIENTPILGAPIENTPPAPPAPVIHPVPLSAGRSPVSPIDLRQFETVSFSRRGSTPLVENRLPTPLTPRTNGATSPRGNLSDTSSDFVYTAETFPLERIVSSDPVRHSRGSHSAMLMQLASNLRVEADEDPDVTAANMRSPDLSMWHTASSTPSLSTTPLIVQDTSSSFYNSPGSPGDPMTVIASQSMQRANPFFGGGSITRRRGSSATSPERETIRSTPERIERLADATEERVGRTLRAGSDPVLLRYAATQGEWPASPQGPSRDSEPSGPAIAIESIPRGPERPNEDPSYVPVTRASVASTTQDQQQHQTIGSFSSAGVGSPSTWSNPLPSARSIISTQRGSAEHEQIFTPGSIYTPLSPEHDEGPTQSPFHEPGSLEVVARDFGSQDSGQGTQGEQHDAYLEYTPRPKEELVTSTTMASASTMSQHSSYHSFPSDTPLLSVVESPSADSTQQEQASIEETPRPRPRPKEPSFRQRLLDAAQRHHMGLPTEYEQRKRMTVTMPTSYLNYNPEDEEYASTNASPTPRFTEIPIAPEPEAKSETPPGPRTIHQALEPQPVRTVVAKVPERPERPASVGLGIVLPLDASIDNAEAGPSGTFELYDPVKAPMERLIASKKKEKKEDAGEYLRNKRAAVRDLRNQIVANVSSGTRSLGRGLFAKGRRSSVMSAPTPILEAQSEDVTPRRARTKFRNCLRPLDYVQRQQNQQVSML